MKRAWFPILLFFAGCIPFASRPPKDEEMVGRFVGRDGSYFLLTLDKKIVFQGIPEVWTKMSADAKGKLSGSGEWRVNNTTLDVTIIHNSETIIRHLPISQKKGRFGLMIEVDAGDSDYLFYDRPER